MANIVKTYSFVNGQPADATQVNKNFDDLLAGINKDVSATDKVLGRATAGAGPVEEIACTAAGRALLDDATAAAQIATLGLDANTATFALPANTVITVAGAALINTVNATAQLITLGAVATGDGRLSDARPASDVSAWAKSGTKPSYTYGEVGAPSTSDARLSNARPASDVSAWAKAASKPAYTAAEVGSKKITTGSFTASGTTKVVTHGLGSTPSFAMVICATAGQASVVSASEFGFTTFFVAYLTFGTDYLWIAFA